VITTLDAAVRLNRYLFEELWSILFKNPPRIMQHYWFNSLLAVALMCILAYSNAFSALWPIFGAANQLLAALSLLAVSSWLLIRGRRYFFAVLPAVFMMATTVTSLFILLRNYLRKGNYILAITDVFLLCLSIGVIILSFKIFLKPAATRTAEAVGR
jgi:carbon starvation protein